MQSLSGIITEKHDSHEPTKCNCLASSRVRNNMICASGIFASLSAGAAVFIAISFTATPITVAALSSLALLTLACAITAYWIATMQSKRPIAKFSLQEKEAYTCSSILPSSEQIILQDPSESRQDKYQKELAKCQQLEEFSGVCDKDFFQKSHISKKDNKLQQLICEFVKGERELCIFGQRSTKAAHTCLQFIEEHELWSAEIQTIRLRHKDEVALLKKALDSIKAEHELNLERCKSSFQEKLVKLAQKLNLKEDIKVGEIETNIKKKEEKLARLKGETLLTPPNGPYGRRETRTKLELLHSQRKELETDTKMSEQDKKKSASKLDTDIARAQQKNKKISNLEEKLENLKVYLTEYQKLFTAYNSECEKLEQDKEKTINDMETDAKQWKQEIIQMLQKLN